MTSRARCSGSRPPAATARRGGRTGAGLAVASRSASSEAASQPSTTREMRSDAHSSGRDGSRARRRGLSLFASSSTSIPPSTTSRLTTLAELRWLLGKAVGAFGDVPVSELSSQEIAAWRMTIFAGPRFEATQALRQVLARAVDWGLIDTNPAKVGVGNPQRRPAEMRPFASWDEIDAFAAALGRLHGAMVVFAAATGMRPSEWLALEHRDIDRAARVVYVHRSFTNGRLKCTKTEASVRAVPPRARALDALDRLPSVGRTPLLFPSPSGGYLDLHNLRVRVWRPAQRRAGIDPVRRVYDLRHTSATPALRAGISTFDLSRYMGASLTMIDRHYGHLAHDGRQHAIDLLDAHAVVEPRWTPQPQSAARACAANPASSGDFR